MVFTDPPVQRRELRQHAEGQTRAANRAILNDNLGDGFYDFRWRR